LIEFAALSLLFATAVQGDESAQARADASAIAAVATINDACVPIAIGSSAEPDMGNADQRSAFLDNVGFAAGIPPEARVMLSDRQYASLLTGAVVGHKPVSRDFLLLAVGGQDPYCRVLVASPSIALADGSELDAAALASGFWREAPMPIPQGDSFHLRPYLHVPADGNAVLLVIGTGTIPTRRNTVVLMTAPVPPDVELPEGF
jgi:hypothetical protein